MIKHNDKMLIREVNKIFLENTDILGIFIKLSNIYDYYYEYEIISMTFKDYEIFFSITGSKKMKSKVYLLLCLIKIYVLTIDFKEVECLDISIIIDKKHIYIIKDNEMKYFKEIKKIVGKHININVIDIIFKY